MPDDVKDLLEAVDAPRMHVDPQAVVAGGRRRHRRRTAAGTGLLAAVVAVLAIGATAGRDLGHVAVPAATASSTTATTSTPSTDPSPQRLVKARVVLDVGHCWIEDVVFDGRAWGLTQQQQLGTGGGMPAGWQGAGVMERLSADRARYTDDGGKVLTFLPVDDPTVLRPRGCI